MPIVLPTRAHRILSFCAGLSEQRSFLEWLSRLIIASLYPGAASQRKVTALMILNLIQQEWFPSNFQEGMEPSFNGQGEGAMSRSSIREKPSAASGQVFVPFCQGFMGAPMTQSLLGKKLASCSCPLAKHCLKATRTFPSGCRVWHPLFLLSGNFFGPCHSFINSPCPPVEIWSHLHADPRCISGIIVAQGSS